MLEWSILDGLRSKIYRGKTNDFLVIFRSCPMGPWLIGLASPVLMVCVPNLGFLWVFFKYPKISKIENPLFFPVTEPGGLALLAGDASVDSSFREIHVPRAWRVYLATGLDFREKNRASFESIGT